VFASCSGNRIPAIYSFTVSPQYIYACPYIPARGRRWKLIHRLVYFAVPLSLLHYFWLERDIRDWVIIYIVIVAFLFTIRLPFIRRAISGMRYRRQPVTRENNDSA